MILPKLLALFAMGLLVFSTSSSLLAQQLIDLDTIGGISSSPLGINDSGQVVGTYSMGDATSSTNAPFLYSDGTMIDLGTFGGNNGGASAINNLGQIIGYSSTSINGTISDPFLYSNGTLTNLSASLGHNSNVFSINDSAQIVGQTPNGPFVYAGGVFTDLSPFLNNAKAINNSGQILGTSKSDNSLVVLYSEGTIINLESFTPTALNNLGQVTGGVFNSNTSTLDAVLYSNGTLKDLNIIGGSPNFGSAAALDLNDLGQTVGFTTISNKPDIVAFLYTDDAGMQDLNALYSSLLVSGTDSRKGFVSLDDANAINNSGEIAGQGTYWDGTSLSTQAFLLIPAPEPSTWAMLFGGCAFLIALRLRQTRKA